MSMTRRDYIAISAALAGVRAKIETSEVFAALPSHFQTLTRRELAETSARAAIGAVAENIADLCQENPRFDRARFLAACKGSKG